MANNAPAEAAVNLPALENRVFYLPGDEPKEAYMRPQFPTQSKEKLKEILATGSSTNPTIIPDGAQKVRDALNTTYQPFYIIYKEAQENPGELPEMISEFVDSQLQLNSAIIAGGFMLKALGLFNEETRKDNTDIDVYVNCRNLKQLNEKLPQAILGNINRRTAIKSSTYCLSFLRRNGIRSVQTSKYTTKVGRVWEQHSIDIMGVRNHRSPIQVAENFDLTFVQVWYDGVNVYATHPEHVKNKIGYLQRTYVPLYLAGNQFLRRRMDKYIRRGFQVFLDPSATEDIDTMRIPGFDKSSSSELQSIRSRGECARILSRTPLFFKDYVLRSMLEYIVSKKYILRSIYNPQEVDTTEGYDSDEYGALEDLTPLWDTRLPQPNISFDKLFDLAKEKAGPEFAEKDGKAAFYSTASTLFQLFFSDKIVNDMIVSPILEGIIDDNNPITKKETINKILNDDLYEYPYAGNFLKSMRDALFEKGDDMFGGEGTLYTFHAHDYPDQGITQESLETYLMGKKQIRDKNTIPCYAAPYCTKNLTLSEIRPFVSNDFYKEFSKEIRVIPNLRNTAFDIAPMILQNIQSEDPLGFGNIYHYTMCPFCLVLEERNEGCAYMVHKNEKRLGNNEAPWCDPEIVVKEIRDKYVAARDTPELMPDYPPGWRKLEFCVECGCPSVSHNHFTTTDPLAIAPHRLDPDVEGNETYGVCDGGGRAELLARMLAVRKVIMENPGASKKEVRRLAAIAADAAPQNEELMEKGREMLAVEAAERKWTNQEQVNAFVAANPVAENKEDEGEEEENNNNVQSIASDASNENIAEAPAPAPAAPAPAPQPVNPFMYIPIVMEELAQHPLPQDQGNILRPDVINAAWRFYNEKVPEHGQDEAIRATQVFARIATRAGARAFLAGRTPQQVAQVVRRVGQLAEILLMGAHEENVFEQAQNLEQEIAQELVNQQGGKKNKFAKTHKRHGYKGKKQSRRRN